MLSDACCVGAAWVLHGCCVVLRGCCVGAAWVLRGCCVDAAWVICGAAWCVGSACGWIREEERAERGEQERRGICTWCVDIQ